MNNKLADELQAVFQQTRADTDANAYVLSNGSSVSFIQSPMMHRTALVVAADGVLRLIDEEKIPLSTVKESSPRVIVRCIDSLGGAHLVHEMCSLDAVCEKPPLVLNFAHPYDPGGGAMHGSMTQEEDLCRRTTLYASLVSDDASRFYEDNKANGSLLFTHGMVVSPYVEVFRDSSYEYLDEPFQIAVLTCSAPFVPELEGVSEEELFSTLKNRITGMLLVAAQNGYRDFVAGAWGCGAFGNSPEMVARAFREALSVTREVADAGRTYRVRLAECFDTVLFAVLDRAPDQHVLRTFKSFLDDD